jgi:hypothetical protein
LKAAFATGDGEGAGAGDGFGAAVAGGGATGAVLGEGAGDGAGCAHPTSTIVKMSTTVRHTLIITNFPLSILSPL